MQSMRFVTPVGVFSYPKVNEPDKKFGKFEVTLVLTTDEAREMASKVKAWAVETLGSAKAAKAAYPWKVDQEKGTVELKARTKNQPNLVRANGLPYEPDQRPAVGSGTKGRLAVSFATYTSPRLGINCYLNGAQVIDLVEWSGNSGLGAIEGYEDLGTPDTPIETADELFSQDQSLSAGDVDF